MLEHKNIKELRAMQRTPSATELILCCILASIRQFGGDKVKPQEIVDQFFPSPMPEHNPPLETMFNIG